MSDHHDRMIQETGDRIARVYTLIVKICANLPLPIDLPSGMIIEGSEAIPAVKRAVEIIQDQPIPNDVQMGIWGGCLHWLSAAHLFTALIDNDDRVLKLEIEINLATGGEALVLAGKLLREQE